MENLDKYVEKLKNPRGRKYSAQFTDYSIWPFLGENKGKRLKDITIDFWVELLDKHKDRKANWPKNNMTILDYLLGYARRRVKKESTKPRNYWVKDRIWINNGIINKFHDKNIPIPKGFNRGMKIRPNT